MGPPNARGVEVISDTFIKLSKLGLKIVVVTTLDHFRDHKDFYKWKRSVESKNLKIHVTDLSWLTKKSRYAALGLSKILTTIVATKVAFQEKPEVVHEYSATPFLFLRTFIVSLFGNSKSIHTLITYNNVYLSGPLWGMLGNLLTKVIFPSKVFAKKYSKNIKKEKVVTQSQGVDMKKFMRARERRQDFKLPNNKKIILYLGPPEKNKG